MTWTVRIAPGEGIVCRREGVLLLAAPKGKRQQKLLDELLLAIDEVVQVEPDTPGRQLARRIAGVVSASEPENVPSFCLLAAVAEGVATFVHGEAELELGNGEVLSGRDVATWVDRIVREDTTLTARLDPDATPDVRTHLQNGIVPGAAVTLILGEVPPHEDDAGDDESAVPLAKSKKASAAPEFDAGDHDQDHDDDEEQGRRPSSPFAIPSVRSRRRPARPLGVLVLEDGQSLPLNTDYVLGREPAHAEEVRAGAVALALDDTAATLSRVHAKVEVRAGEVQVTDLGSANGTYVARRGDAEWTKLEPYLAKTIEHDTRITLGGRSVLYDAES